MDENSIESSIENLHEFNCDLSDNTNFIVFLYFKKINNKSVKLINENF